MVVKVTLKRAPAAADMPPSSPGEGCGLLLSRLARATNQALACALSDLGLRSQQFAILHLLTQGGPASQTELADELGVHASNLVRLLDELAERGLVVRRRDPRDRRRQIVVPTKAGAQMLARAEQVTAEVESDLLASLDASEQRQLKSLLARLAARSCGRSPAQGCSGGEASPGSH